MSKNLESAAQRYITQNNSVICSSDGVYVKVLPNAAFDSVEEEITKLTKEVETLKKDKNNLLWFIDALKSAARQHIKNNSIFDSGSVESACSVIMSRMCSGLSGT